MTKKKKWGKNGCILFFLMLMIWGLVLVPEKTAEAVEYFDIQQYHVDITVSEDNVLTVREIIVANFFEPRHGIYRNIPVRNEVWRADGSRDIVEAEIRGVSCGSDKFSVSRSGKNVQIKIGDEDEMVSGTHTYQISYQYDMGNDVLKGADEFYYNVVGTEWTTSVSNVTFAVTMPKEFDESKLGISQGVSGSTNTEGLAYTIEGNKIIGMLDPNIVLSPGEGVTVRLELPDGYFLKKNRISWIALGSILMAVMTCIAGYALWSNYGRDDPVTETVEFYPPEDINSVEAAYLYKGELPSEDVVSLIVYLAQQGYLSIQDAPGGKWSKESFVLVKKRDYAGTKMSERLFLEGLFQGRDMATKASLENRFYKTIDQVVSQVSNQYRQKVFYGESLNKNWILYLMLVIVYFTAAYRPLAGYLGGYTALSSLGMTAIFITLAFRALFGSRKLWSRIIASLSVGVIGLLNCWRTIYLLLAMPKWHKTAFVVAVLASGIVAFFAAYMPRRTLYGNQMLGKLGGFKRFLETAEKPRLEAMVKENPQYFFDILPYAYVLDVSDTWMKKFESIAVEPPDWYHGYSHTYLNMRVFQSFMDTTMRSAQTSMTSKPRSSGGGRVGGGSGGGGGGSW